MHHLWGQGFALKKVKTKNRSNIKQIANIIDFPNALSVEHFANGRVALMEFKVKEDSPLCQTTISDFRKQFGNVIICAIERDNKLTIPDGDFSIKANDKIFLTGNRYDIMLFHHYIRPRVIKSLMIIGAGKIAYYLLNILKDSKIDLKVLEVNRQRAEWFS